MLIADWLIFVFIADWLIVVLIAHWHIIVLIAATLIIVLISDWYNIVLIADWIIVVLIADWHIIVLIANWLTVVFIAHWHLIVLIADTLIVVLIQCLYSVVRRCSCWILNWWCITWPLGFKRLNPFTMAITFCGFVHPCIRACRIQRHIDINLCISGADIRLLKYSTKLERCRNVTWPCGVTWKANGRNLWEAPSINPNFKHEYKKEL